jgi:hypothetical protein
MKEITTDKIQTAHYHRFLDEAGDTTFYAKGRVPMLGNEGVSKTFILGMFSLNEPLKNVREKVIALQDEIEMINTLKEFRVSKRKSLNMDIICTQKMIFQKFGRWHLN